MIMVNRTSLKFIGGFVLIIALAMGGLYFLNYYFSAEQKSIRYYKNLERQYAEDTYGGQTPEETLQLFIDALKAGDIELASKYFVVEKQGEWFKNIEKVQKNGHLDDMIEDLMRVNKSKEEVDSALFVGTNEKNIASLIISMGFNDAAGIWKIIGM